MAEKITKRPLSAFMFFMKVFRENNKGNSSSIGEAAKEASLKWKSLQEVERKVYQDMADKDKKRFEADLAAGMVTSSKKSKKAAATKKGARKHKDPNAPKKAKTAYMCFLAEYRKTSSLTGAKFVSKAAEVWKEISEKDKEKYVQMGLEDKKRYNDELEKYKKSGGSTGGGVGSNKKSKPTKPAGKNSIKSAKHNNDDADDESTDFEESGDDISTPSDSE